MIQDILDEAVEAIKLATKQIADSPEITNNIGQILWNTRSGMVRAGFTHEEALQVLIAGVGAFKANKK